MQPFDKSKRKLLKILPLIACVPAISLVTKESNSDFGVMIPKDMIPCLNEVKQCLKEFNNLFYRIDIDNGTLVVQYNIIVSDIAEIVPVSIANKYYTEHNFTSGYVLYIPTYAGEDFYCEHVINWQKPHQYVKGLKTWVARWDSPHNEKKFQVIIDMLDCLESYNFKSFNDVTID